jgi:hypothetical protein
MGYTTDFCGCLAFNVPVAPEHIAYLNAFSDTRRMKRHPAFVSELPDPIRKAAGLPVGVDGEFFVGGRGPSGQDQDHSILMYNSPPATQPGLWCDWEVNAKDNTLEWNGSEKFYNYVEWLEYLIANFITPWGYILNGQIKWEGEDRDDTGTIIVKNNVVEVSRD